MRQRRVKKRSVPRMGVVGGLSDMAENIAVSKGLKSKKSDMYSGGIGQAVENLFTGIGKGFKNANWGKMDWTKSLSPK